MKRMKEAMKLSPHLDQKNLEVRKNLALAYQILGKWGWDDLTYTHLTARIDDRFLIHPFGHRFSEINHRNLIEVDFHGNVCHGQEDIYNPTAYTLHGEIYKARPDIQAIFHLHTIDGCAISSMNEGLLPISQHALHFYDRLAYYDYDSLALNPEEQGMPLIQSLGDKYVMFLRNHGTLTAGRTIHEAFYYTYHLERACQIQCKVLAMNAPYITPSKDVCEKSVKDLLSFEKDLGYRDWQSLQREFKED
jgi:ribulose-5-phosphate 4-epimerase/fuculose-1-phosphate aldolase